MARALRIKDHWAEQRLFGGRLAVAAFAVVAMAGLVVSRLVQLQVVQYDDYSAQSRGNRIRVEPVPPIRGLILDRDGKLLAASTPSYQLEMTPEQVPDLEETLQRLVSTGILPADELEDLRDTIRARRPFDTIVVAERLGEDELASFSVQRPRFPGLEIEARLGRYYPYGAATAHLLGYVGSISAADKETLDPIAYAGTSHVGKISVEKNYEAELHGTGGHVDVVVNAHGRRMQRLKRVRSLPGKDLILAIDLEAQLAADTALAGKRGAAVAIDPRNGEVLVLSSTPAFDPNVMSAGIGRKAYIALQEDIDRPMFNRALRGQYPPGSTIKPIVAMAGLHYGTTTPERRVGCGGAYSIPGSSHRYRDWKPNGHGSVDMINGIAQSCDVYFYGLARDIGIQRLSDFMKTFGLGSLTGIDVGGEQSGIVPSPAWKKKAFRKASNQIWFPGETVITGIGQGYMLTTPLQLAHATATIAARGKRFEPRVLKGLRDPATGRVEYIAPRPLPGVPDSEALRWDTIIEGMHSVMHGANGTARAVGAGAPFQMAGKSGTAQVFTVAQNKKYNAAEVDERRRDHALFVAFAPLEDPRIAVAVIIENGESGSKAAAPIARKVMEAYLVPSL
jgi:penicillin-binding protein 2